MRISLKQLENYQGEPFYFDEVIQIEESLLQREKQLLAVSPAHVTGYMLYESASVLVQFKCEVTVTLPSSRSLEPVDLKMEIPIVERYVFSDQKLNELDEKNLQEIIIPLIGDWIDLQPAVEDSILLEIPLQILTDEEKTDQTMPSGKHWTVVSEEQYQSQKQQQQAIDPRLASLQSFFDSSDEAEN